MRAVPRFARPWLALWLALHAAPAVAFELFDGALQLHGYSEVQLRTVSDGFRGDRWFFSQWANVVDLEVEWDVAKDGWGPFDSVSAFARGELRFDCVWSQACGLSRTTTIFGDRGNRAPANLANGVTSGYTGVVPTGDSHRIQNPNGNLVRFYEAPPLDGLTKLGANNLEGTFRPVLDTLITTKQLGGSLGPITLPQGPWPPEVKIRSIGALASVQNITSPRPPQPTLPYRPPVPNENLGTQQAHGLYAPSQALLREMDEYRGFDQNFTQNQLQWNHGASQGQTRELKELYVDLELLDGALFLRLGKQNIVWGKTELFRTTDQFNPQDLALSSLPSLEESRIPLWAARAIYSLYDVGPLEDFRIEVAANLDGYQPIDFGKCGEPYTIFLVCAKSFGLFGHGLVGAGIAGEKRPWNWWEDVSGLELGARVEFRWERFSFAITDFWGYSDVPTADTFNTYERKVDPVTGAPLDVNGNPLTPATALALHPANRQLFDVFCSATVGIAGNVIPALAGNCILDLLNSPVPIALGLTPAAALGSVFAGAPLQGNFILRVLSDPTLAKYPSGTSFSLVTLNADPGDGPGGGPLPLFSLSRVLTTQQEALLGCGPLYGTNCDDQGIDVFNAEASAMLQAFPQFEPGGPIATRTVNGQLVQLPGSRGPGDPGYDPMIDGCTGTTDAQGKPIAACLLSNGGAGAFPIRSPLTGQRYADELGGFSWNFMMLLYSLGTIREAQSECSSAPFLQNRVPTAAELLRCQFVQGIFSVAGTQRPEVQAGGNGRYGRRDFLWSSGGEIQLFYQKRNVLGFATDFAEDTTKTNWSLEFTWFANEAFANTTSDRGYSNMDSLNLTISVDRPTFVHFLNASRTIFYNMQWFVRYLPEYQGLGTYTTNGPFSLLGTFSVFTGYFQDRLLPGLTVLYDVQSQSGGVLGQVTYRFSEVFSATFGVANFFGTPANGRIPLRQALLGNNGGDFMQRTRFEGLSAIAERDEVYLTLRYTF